jgi:ABC-type transporter Mla subunit MlaD
MSGLVAVGVAGVLTLSSGGASRHRIHVVLPEAASVVQGQWVRSAGLKVGEITGLTAVDGGRRARVDIELDDSAWPLSKGTTMTLRWGGTVNYSNRYINLQRGPSGAPQIAQDGSFPASAFVAPPEFDALLRTFTPKLRHDARTLLDTAAPAVKRAKAPLQATLRLGPAALDQASFVLQDLDADKAALHTLVRSTDSVLGSVDRAQPGLRTLLSGAATTFAAIAGQSDSLRSSLGKLPGTLDRTRSTLARADRTLDLAADVTGRLAPGVSELRRIAAPLNDTLAAVTRITPDAKATLADVRRATPQINPLLEQLTQISPQLASIGSQAVDNLKCIRPYTPSIMSFFSNWGDFFSYNDGKDKFIRAQVQNFLPAYSNASTLNAGQAAKLFPGLTYGFPRPPGTNAGTPWLIPECGIGPDALNPNKDPEARPFSQILGLPPQQSAKSLLGGGR